MSDWIGARTLDVEMVDGTKYRVRTIFADAVAYETTARKHGWGAPRDSVMQSLAFVCWHALKRTGDIDPGVQYEPWRDTLAQVRPDTGADEFPTVPGPVPG